MTVKAYRLRDACDLALTHTDRRVARLDSTGITRVDIAVGRSDRDAEQMRDQTKQRVVVSFPGRVQGQAYLQRSHGRHTRQAYGRAYGQAIM